MSEISGRAGIEFSGRIGFLWSGFSYPLKSRTESTDRSIVCGLPYSYSGTAMCINGLSLSAIQCCRYAVFERLRSRKFMGRDLITLFTGVPIDEGVPLTAQSLKDCPLFYFFGLPRFHTCSTLRNELPR